MKKFVTFFAIFVMCGLSSCTKEDSVELVAFAYYMDDYILESYGLLEWAENLPEKAISMTNLAQRYRIFGL